MDSQLHASAKEKSFLLLGRIRDWNCLIDQVLHRGSILKLSLFWPGGICRQKMEETCPSLQLDSVRAKEAAVRVSHKSLVMTSGLGTCQSSHACSASVFLCLFGCLTLAGTFSTSNKPQGQGFQTHEDSVFSCFFLSPTTHRFCGPVYLS